MFGFAEFSALSAHILTCSIAFSLVYRFTDLDVNWLPPLLACLMVGRSELAKVYVSSMIADLTEERRSVLGRLRLARHQAVDSYLLGSGTVRVGCSG
jgi:hypothetical protein